MGRDERRRRRRGGRRAARRPRHQQLRALPRRRHPVRVAAGADAAAAARRHLRDARVGPPAATLAQGRQGTMDILVRRRARPERARCTGIDLQP